MWSLVKLLWKQENQLDKQTNNRDRKKNNDNDNNNNNSHDDDKKTDRQTNKQKKTPNKLTNKHADLAPFILLGRDRLSLHLCPTVMYMFTGK